MIHSGDVTRYLSDATLTNMRSSPTRTFSPSDLCLEAGCIVHQQDSPETAKIMQLFIFIDTVHRQNGRKMYFYAARYSIQNPLHLSIHNSSCLKFLN